MEIVAKWGGSDYLIITKQHLPFHFLWPRTCWIIWRSDEDDDDDDDGRSPKLDISYIL